MTTDTEEPGFAALPALGQPQKISARGAQGVNA
mgnify:FL=1